MKNLLLLLLLLLSSATLSAQTPLSGQVTDRKGNALPGANVLLKGTYDGATTDTLGKFSFKTFEKDSVTLQISYVGYEPFERKLTLQGKPHTFTVKLEEAASELNTVVITAGSFEASDEKRMTMLKPLDIVTTAGGGADITAVMQLLPGAQRVGEQAGLFVRGGSGQEAKVVIDGMIVQNPFFSAVPDVQQRGRFNPFMFKGTAFSTGGYSAQYGQALSSVLLLSTSDKASNNGLGVSLNLASAGLNYDVANEKQSLSVVGYYGNLKPLFALVKQNVEWTREPEFIGSSVTYRLKTSKTGLLKTYGMYSDSRLGMVTQVPLDNETRTGIKLHNRNAFTTSTYTDSFAEGKWRLLSGFSYSHNSDETTFDESNFGGSDERIQGRAVLTRLLSKNNTLLFGTEIHRINLQTTYNDQRYALHDNYAAAFAETEIYVTRKLAGRIGLRTEYSSLLNRFNLAPRLSFAYKTGEHSQVSLAAGQFFQNPDYRYLYKNPDLNFERADHLILNYQRIKDKRTFRIEGFYKNYAQLVREFTSRPGTPFQFDANPYRFPWGRTTNGGNGFAQGFDVFWRDQKTIKNFDYWLTYSYVDTKRLFEQFQQAATPTFVSNHNASLITKKWFEKITTSANFTYSYTSGRPYYNPNRDDGPRGDGPNDNFLADRTPPVHNLSFSASKIMTIKNNFTVLYLTVDNLLNTRNVFTYRYTPDGQTRYAVGPQSYRSFFVGMQIMLSKKAVVGREDV